MSHPRLALVALCCALGLLCACGAQVASGPRPDCIDAVQSVCADADKSAFGVFSLQTDGTATFAQQDAASLSQEESAARAAELLDFLGLDPTLVDSGAGCVSDTFAATYAVCVFRPKSGNESAVQTALSSFVSLQCSTLQGYLPEQYAIAQQALVRNTASGDVLLVLCANAPGMAKQLENALR